jgi:hydrogenase-4 component F
VTEAIRALVHAAPLLAVLAGVLAAAAPSPRAADQTSQVGGLAAGGAVLALAGLAVAGGDGVVEGAWYRVDAAAGLFLAVIGVVGTLSVLVSPAYLRHTGRGMAGALASRRWYHLGLHLFWAALVAVPVAGNLGVAWVLVEATTAASALLIAFSGKGTALEAGWKYLVLTTAGLTVALLGIVMLHAIGASGKGGLGALGWERLAQAAPGLPHGPSIAAFLLVLAGLAAKVGWAPVHNWLPDAHGEAPPPVSALLSAALLPAVALVAWRLDNALGVAVGEDASQLAFIGFGIASLAVAAPFLWRPLAWKRLLAYSSLEHMGVLAVAIGLHEPLATAGGLLHVAGHALAKSLGFYAAVPILRYQPAAGRRPARGLVRLSRPVGAAAGVSLGALSGLPPSPLFLSEVLVLAGAVAAGLAWVAGIVAALLALGFLGLAHALVEGLSGTPSGRRPAAARATRQIALLTVGLGAGLLALLVAGLALPGSAIARALEGPWS